MGIFYLGLARVGEAAGNGSEVKSELHRGKVKVMVGKKEEEGENESEMWESLSERATHRHAPTTFANLKIPLTAKETGDWPVRLMSLVDLCQVRVVLYFSPSGVML